MMGLSMGGDDVPAEGNDALIVSASSLFCIKNAAQANFADILPLAGPAFRAPLAAWRGLSEARNPETAETG
jgi:hypothetical protein